MSDGAVCSKLPGIGTHGHRVLETLYVYHILDGLR